MKLGLVSARAPVTVAAAPQTKRTFTASWDAAVRRWLWGRGSTDLEEVSHEVFIRFQGYSDATLMKCPQTFVLKVAANVLDEWCGAPRNEWLDEEMAADRERGAGEKDKGKSVNKTLAKQLQAAVDKLPLRQRQVLLMHVNEGLTYEQIAQKLKMTPGIVRRDLVRAYAGVRGGMGQRELDLLSKL